MYLIYKTDEPYVFDRIRKESDLYLKRRQGWSIVTPKTFGKRLAKLRDRLGFTQKEMAKYLNSKCRHVFSTNERKYRRWEAGKTLKRFLTLENLYTLSSALGVPVSYFTLTRASIPPIWEANSILNEPTRTLGKEPKLGFDLQIYVVQMRWRAEEQTCTVLATSQSDAKRYALEEFDGARILEVKHADWEAGVVA